MCLISYAKLSEFCHSSVIVCENCLTVGKALILCLRFPVCKTAEEELDLRAAVRLSTRKGMRLKFSL